MPNGHKADQDFSLQGFPKLAKIGIFWGMQTIMQASDSELVNSGLTDSGLMNCEVVEYSMGSQSLGSSTLGLSTLGSSTLGSSISD
jgi:hypothetical protein